MKWKIFISGFALAGAAAWSFAQAAAADASVCPFAEGIRGKIATIGPLRINYCEGFGTNSAARRLLEENGVLSITFFDSIETEIKKARESSPVLSRYTLRPIEKTWKILLSLRRVVGQET
ncbi:hypothetical protein [Breoghania sp.]|uniref:hypothetical protein n=1 Tax=Breoghania sp. TaxID=2065378 RepID=UPI002604D2DA|nr:hypothetical protein [Breoghania sp.]